MYTEDNNLPFRMSFKPSRTGWYYRYSKSSDHRVNGITSWMLLERLLKNNVGKSFDMAFHYWCKLVPKYMQYIFLEKFDREPRFNRWKPWYVDEDGNIQKRVSSNKYKGPYTIKSEDYKILYKRIKPKWYRLYNPIKDKLEFYDDPNDYEKIIQGQIYSFDSKKDPQYIKLKRERFKRNQREDKAYKKLRKLESLKIFNTSIQSAKEAARKEKELDILKRNQAGFDEESFKGQFYHGRKNKLS